MVNVASLDKKDWAIIGTVLGLVTLLLLSGWRLLTVSELGQILAGIIVASMIGLNAWAFKDHFDSSSKNVDVENEKNHGNAQRSRPRKVTTLAVKRGFFSLGPDWVGLSPSEIEESVKEYKKKYRLIERETLLGINTYQPHLEVVMVYAKFAFRARYLRRQGAIFPANKRLIINHNTNVAYHSPRDDLHLWAVGVLKAPKPMFAVSWDSILKNWAEQKGYNFVDDVPSDEQLLAGLKE